MKLNSPDYCNVPLQKALEDFKKRIKNYEKAYMELSNEDEEHYSFIKIIETGKKYLINNLTGIL